MKLFESGEGTALVFIHGFPFHHKIWEQAVKNLDTQYKVVLVELPGISEEELSFELSMEKMAEMLSITLQEKDIHQCILFGHSMGGYLAAEFLSKYPKKLLGLSLIHSLASADSEEKKEQRDKIIRFLEKGENEKMPFLKTMIPNLFSDKTKEKLQKDIQDLLYHGSKIPVYNILQLYKSIRNRNDHTNTIEQSSVPIQWIIGEDDDATPLSIALTQSHLSKISDVEILKNCGHMSMYEYPNELKHHIQKFCEIVLK